MKEVECVMQPVLGPIPNGAGTMVLRVVFLFLSGDAVWLLRCRSRREHWVP